MALPKIEYPLYEIYVKSLDRKVKFRPFLVKEEKILLMAKESKDPDTVRLAVKQIIVNCCSETLDVDTLPLFDIEMIFLKLRAKSVGESVKLVFNCQNEVDGKVCNANTNYTVDLNKIDYEIPEGHDSTVMITETQGVKLKYPTLATHLELGEDLFEDALIALLSNIECVFDSESVYKIEDATEQEQIAFIESLSQESLEKIADFFRSTPKVVLTDVVKCSACGYDHVLHTEGLLSFFT
jgi:predicted Zn-ribbon and HTH transcriptional regulator